MTPYDMILGMKQEVDILPIYLSIDISISLGCSEREEASYQKESGPDAHSDAPRKAKRDNSCYNLMIALDQNLIYETIDHM